MRLPAARGRSTIPVLVVGVAIAACLLLASSAEGVTVTSGNQHIEVSKLDCAGVFGSEAIRCFHQPHLLLTPGAGGADTVWISANDAGEAAGQKVLKNGVTHFAFFDGFHARDITAQLGAPGSFSSIDQLGGKFGTLYRNNTPFPVYVGPGSRKKVVLPKPGRATGGAIGPIGTVAFNSGMAGIWNPSLNSLVEFGPFKPSGANASGLFTGQLPNNHVGLGMPNGSGGVILQDLGFEGNGVHITNWNVITGHIDRGDRMTPFSYDLAKSKLTEYKLPPGFHIGSALGMSDNGKITYGNAFKSMSAVGKGHSIPVEWWNPNRPRELPGLKGDFDPLKGRYGAVTTITDIRITTGEITHRGRDIGFLWFPAPFEKLEELEEMADEILDGELQEDVDEAMSRVVHLLDLGRAKPACRRLANVGSMLKDEADYLESLEGPFAGEDIALYDDMVGGLEEFAREIGCGKVPFPLAHPRPFLYPYAGVPAG